MKKSKKPNIKQIQLTIPFHVAYYFGFQISASGGICGCILLSPSFLHLYIASSEISKLHQIVSQGVQFLHLNQQAHNHQQLTLSLFLQYLLLHGFYQNHQESCLSSHFLELLVLSVVIFVGWSEYGPKMGKFLQFLTIN